MNLFLKSVVEAQGNYWGIETNIKINLYFYNKKD